MNFRNVDKKKILFGAGIYGRRALNYFGDENVNCFADNKKAGQTFWGKRIISFDELVKIHNDYNIVLTVNAAQYPSLEEQCKKHNINFNTISDLVTCENFSSNPMIAKFKDKHMGERCFLIGNGPSLFPDDLTLLHKHGEISFACNKISKIFEHTPWRPKYYVGVDPILLAFESEVIANTEADYKFLPELDYIYAEDISEIKKAINHGRGEVSYLRPITISTLDETPRFSPDPSKSVYLCATVMEVMIQLAVYMGFTYIYLLGVDGSQMPITNPTQFLSEKRHFYDDDADSVRKYSKYKVLPTAEDTKKLTTRVYQQAEIFTREHGVKIYNATRGGLVEDFERVNIDLLF